MASASRRMERNLRQLKRALTHGFATMGKEEWSAIFQPDRQHDERVERQRDGENEEGEDDVEESFCCTREAAALTGLNAYPEGGAGLDFLPLERFHGWARFRIVPQNLGADNAGFAADFPTGSNPQGAIRN